MNRSANGDGGARAPLAGGDHAHFPGAGAGYDPVRAAAMMSRRGHGSWLGLAYHAHGDGWLELRLPWDSQLVGVEETGVLASGPIISLMDNATSMAVWTLTNRFVPHATLDLRVDYMRAARPGTAVIGRGECYKLTRTIAFVRGIAYDETLDDPVAHVMGTFMATQGTYL